MKYRVAIVEDNAESVKMLKAYIARFEKENNEHFEIFTFSDGDEITSDYEAKYDVIFLDIMMSRVDGMSAAQTIRSFDKSVIIIFITNTPQYAIKGYQVDALSYLLKPVPYFAFCQEMKKSLEKIKQRKNVSILLTTENGIVKLDVSDIYYVETMKHDLLIHSKSGDHVMKAPLKKIVEMVKGAAFVLCNSCYLINLDEVTGVNGDFVVINGKELKISRPRKKVFMEALASHFGGKL